MLEREIKLIITKVESTFVAGEVMGLPEYMHVSDEGNRARYLAEDQRNNAVRTASSQQATQLSKEEQARRSAESRVVTLKNVLRLVRDHHIHSFPSEASSTEGLCCEFCRQIDEALRL